MLVKIVEMNQDAVGLEIKLLGPFELLVRGEQAPRLRSRQAQALLALLVLADGREYHREHLASLLWPDSQTEQASANLRQNLASLRTALGPEAVRLRTPDRRSISLDLTGARVDVVEFKRSGDLDLYRGPLLPGLHVEALISERDALQRRFEQLLATAIASHADTPEGEELAFRLLREDPMSETAVCAILRFRASQADVAGVIRVYDAFRRTVRRFDDAAPTESTKAVYKAALARAQQGVTTQESMEWVPAPLRTLFGREEELESLQSLAANHRLVTVVGPAGIGKSHLLAHFLRAQNPRRGVWLDCSELPAGASMECIVDAARSGLGLSSDAPLEAEIRRAPLVFVFDGVEGVLAGVASFINRFSRVSTAMFLCTGREPLGLSGEQVIRLEGLSPERAVELIASRIGEHSHSAADLEPIAQRLEGTPIALEMVAPLLKAMSAKRLLELIESRGAMQLAESMEASQLFGTYEVAWNALEADLQQLLTVAAACDGPLNSADWLAMAGNDADELRIAQLVRKSWVIHDLTSRFTPYRLPGVARDFLRTRSARCDRRAVIQTFAKLADRCRAQLCGENSSEVLEELLAHHRNLRQAFEWAVEDGLGEEAHRIAGATWGERKLRGESNQARKMLAQCLTLPCDDVTSRVCVMNALGFLHLNNGEFDASVELHQAALELADKFDEPQAAAESQARLALAYGDHTDFARSLKEYNAALNRFRALRDRWWEATVLHEMSSVYLSLGNLDSAGRKLTKATAIMAELGDTIRVAAMLEDHAYMAQLQGQLTEARRMIVEVAEIYSSKGLVRSGATVSLRLGSVAAEEGKLDEAAALYADAVRLATETGMGQVRLVARTRLAWLNIDRRHLAEAECGFEESYDHATETNQPGWAAQAKEGLAACAILQGDRKEGLLLLAQAWQLRDPSLTNPPDRLRRFVKRYLGEMDEATIWDQLKAKL